MAYKGGIVTLAALLCLGTSVAPQPGRADDRSALALYQASLQEMRSLPQPAFVTFTMRGENDGFGVDLIVQRHLVWLNIGTHSPSSTWQMRHRTDDYATEIVDGSNDKRYVSARAFFDPTWWGTYRALRDGMLDYQPPERPISTFATPAATPTPDLRTIAVVMGPGIYRVQDRGGAPCANGDPGHALHMISRKRDPQYQLNDVIVDLRSNRLCMIRFGIPDSFGFHGVVEQHYAEVGGYWMQTDGFLDGTARFFGISFHHGIWRYHLTDMAFPATIPTEAFVLPAGQ